MKSPCENLGSDSENEEAVDMQNIKEVCNEMMMIRKNQ